MLRKIYTQHIYPPVHDMLLMRKVLEKCLITCYENDGFILQEKIWLVDNLAKYYQRENK